MLWPVLPEGTERLGGAERARRFRARELPVGLAAAITLTILMAHERLDARIVVAPLAVAAALAWRALVAFGPIEQLHPRASALLDSMVLLGAASAPAAVSGEPKSILWIAYICLCQVIALLHGPALVTLLLVVALPQATGLGWHLLGASPLAQSAPGLILVSIAAVTTYAFLTRNYALTRDFRKQLGEQARRAAASQERVRIRGQSHDTLEAALGQLSVLEDRALGGDGGAIAQASDRARSALAELRAAVNGLTGEEIASDKLEALVRRRLAARCEKAGAVLSLEVALRGPLPVAHAYHLLKLLDLAAAQLLSESAGQLRGRIGGPAELEVELVRDGPGAALQPTGDLDQHARALGARLDLDGGGLRLGREAGDSPAGARA